MKKIKILTWDETAIPIATAECYGINPNTPNLVQRVIKQDHLAILRHGFASVRINGLSRVSGRQILRKAHADYLEKSQRYCNLDNPSFILPESIEKLKSGLGHEQALYAIVTEHLNNGIEVFKALRDHGVPKEDARYSFPQCIETSMTMSGNFQMWWDFFNLRIDKRVQKETRDVAIEIFEAFLERGELFSQHPKKDFVI